jgi:hypothetical protein
MRDERTIGSIDLKTVKEKEAREGELHQHRRHYEAMNHVHGAKLHCAIMPEEYVGLRVAIRSLAVCHPTVLDQPEAPMRFQQQGGPSVVSIAIDSDRGHKGTTFRSAVVLHDGTLSWAAVL